MIRPTQRRTGLPRPQPLTLRAALPAVTAPRAALLPVATADHDFLVPNPRPDLTFDPHTLRMMEAG